MLTQHRFTVSFGLALALSVLGLALRNAQLASLAIPPLFYGVSLLLSYLSLPRTRIQARRTVDRLRASEEESIEVSVSLASEGRPFPMVFVHDPLPDGMRRISGESHYQGPISSGPPRCVMRYAITGDRGIHALHGLKALLWPRFGLAVREDTLDESMDLRFLPSHEKLGPVPIRPKRTRAFAGPIRSNIPGAGIDFYGCRAFSPGDDIRRINWRAYARTQELIICDYEQERITDVSLILDARIRAHAFVGVQNTFEYATRAAASLASSFCRQGNNVGLLVYGDVLNWVFPGVGRVQIDRIFDALSQARPAHRLAFEELRNIPARLFLPQSQLVLVSYRLDEADIETLALLKSRGYSVLFISIDTRSLELSLLSMTQDAQDATRIATLRRRLYLGSLERYGVQVIDWDPSIPLGQAMERARRGHRRLTP